MNDVLSKRCYGCGLELPLSAFGKNRSKPDGLASMCLPCKREAYRKYCHRHPGRERERQHKSYWKDVDASRKYHREWAHAHTEAGRNYRRLWRRKIGNRLRENIARRINELLRHGWKSDGTLRLLGCSVDDFIAHLESQFQPGMMWDNYGVNGWHIDHIIPCSEFDLSIPEQQAKCFHYTNLQPMWGAENISKGGGRRWRKSNDHIISMCAS